MKLRFLGTGAADSSPLLQTTYRDRLDKTIRRCASLLIEEQLMIDCGPHALDSLRLQGVNAAGITDLFITHLHGDHYQPDRIKALAQMTNQPLRVWYREDAPVCLEGDHVLLCPLPLLRETEVGNGITVTALPANHAAYPAHYLIRLANGKTLFYGCDGAWLLNETYYHLKNRHLTACVLDATVGDVEDDWRAGEHNCQPMLRLLCKALKKWGSIDDRTSVILSHLATTLHPAHEEFESVAVKDGMLLAYDGMTLLL